ncbi:non-ribosomal peptide synthetase [Vibrio cholerae]|uniref:non-ribosomal peptide synthetase n=2 Tax=Vibrio cholerae TaxID=666 RepID=UPI0010FD0216|nr:non-ribosomal peptide synthetase [Vibrio cholerae]TLE10781.1 amino acid adenylation domain-containing protein [Vibrio cholerae]
MGILNILSQVSDDAVNQDVIRYLADAGHQVHLVSSEPCDRPSIAEYDHHNIRLVSARDVANYQIDYEFCYPDDTSFSGANKVRLGLNFSDDQNIIFNAIVSCSEVERVVSVSNASEVYSNYRETLNLLIELFIDCFIDLGRSDSLSHYELYQGNNDAQLWYEGSFINQQRKDELNRQAKLHDVFLTDDEVNPKCYESIQFKYAWNSTETSLFLLYIQYILNANQEALYGFHKKAKNSELTRYILLQGKANYSDLLPEINDSDKSNIFIDRLYIHSDFPLPRFRFYEHSELPLSMDSGTFFIQIEADGIRIVFNQHVPFFSLIQNYIETFHSRIGYFLSGELNWEEFCRLPEDTVAYYYHAMNPEKRAYPQKTIIELFKEKVTHNPDRIALIAGKTELTYAQLHYLSDALAGFIAHEFKVQPRERIAVQMQRDATLIISLLAIQKLRCAYIPLDENSPEIRIQAILQDSSPALVLLSDEMSKARIPSHISVLAVTKALVHRLENTNYLLPPSQPSIDDLAYIIYTSGTTGTPKGVAVRQRNFVNIASDFSQKIGLTEDSRMLALTTLAFDISTLELFMPLMFGAGVVLSDQKKLLDMNILKQSLENNDVSHIQATPSFWRQVVSDFEGQYLDITVLCGGEAVPIDVAQGLAKLTRDAWNVYGPTETTVWSTAYHLAATNQRVYIGKPLANTQCYVLNDVMQPVAPGVIGELYIAGEGVSAGYFNQPELTSGAFLPNPFIKYGEKHSDSMYKTGDKVRYLPSGDIEFISRGDFQVKLRGHRIELGDIEFAMTEYADVQQAVVQLQKDKGQDIEPYLVGYYTAESPIPSNILKRWLENRLPEYMVPVDFMYLSSIPLNMNGKIDRKALPKIQLSNHVLFIAPESKTQRKLCEFFASALGLGNKKIGIKDDFFSLGGNSLSAIKLVNLINTNFDCDIKIKDIFEQKNVSSITPLVEAGKGDFLYRDYIIEGADVASQYHPFTLNNVQQTYYFGRFKNFELSNVSTHIYHEYVFGFLDHSRLENAFNQLIQRHPSLRTVFENDVQRYLNQVSHYKISYHELSDPQDLEAIRYEYSHKVYSTDTYPLFDILLTKWQGKYVLHVSFDAIIIDMKSFEILFSEWISLYQNPHLILPELQINYRDYHIQYERIRESELFARAERYWQEKTLEMSFKMNLPLVSNPASVEKPRFKRISKTIPHSIWNKVIEKCQVHDISPTAFIAEMFCRLLCYWSDQDRMTLNLTLFNRLPLHAQVDDIIGDFTVLSLFDYQLRSDISARSQFETVHQRLLEDIEHNLFDGVDVQRLLKTHHGLPSNQVVAPVVLTSVIGMKGQASMFDLPLDDSYQGMQYAISQTSQVWLDNKAYETDEGFVAEWDYVEQLFSPQTIEAMHQGYCTLIEQAVERDWDLMALPSVRLPDWQEEIILHLNTTAENYPARTLVDLFEQSPGLLEQSTSVAVIDSELNQRFTYSEIYHCYQNIAASLLRRGVVKGDLVAVLSEKGHWHAVATLGIMKAGAAYIPLHPDWPTERLNEILSQSGCHTVVATNAQRTRLGAEQSVLHASVLDIETLAQETISLVHVAWPNVRPIDLAYVIFTSGSTGQPKGVAISHHGAVNTIEAVNRRFQVTASDKVFALSELSFDLSVYDIFGVLGSGGTVVFPRQADSKNPDVWLSLIHEHQVTLWNTVPQLAGLLIDEYDSKPEIPLNIRLFLLSGDWIPMNLPERISALSQKAEVISLGGATEGSIWSIWYPITQVMTNWTSIPYGTAMPNQAMYVLDNRGEHCPFGVTGEIYIGGDGVALEYWHAPALTKERFLKHPRLGKIYKTGDLGRWSENGYIEFLGRNDNQVKLNGYRVELEEIAAHINKLQGISQALVQIQNREDNSVLVAYLIGEKEQPVPVYDDNKDRFILEQRGIASTGTVAHQLSHDLRQDDYLNRKSYRKFADLPVESSSIQRAQEHVLMQSQYCFSAQGRTAVWEDLAYLLSACAAFTIPDRALPKYRYPSAGSTYSVRTQVGVPTGAGLADYYYYQPINQTLHTLTQSGSGVNCPYIDFVICWDAIVPVYHERAKSLALREVGHMLSLLTGNCAESGIGYHVEVFEPEDGVTQTLACRIYLEFSNESALKPELNMAFMKRDGRQFQDQAGAVYDLDAQSVFLKSSDINHIMSNAHGLIRLEGEHSALNYIYSGWLFQRLGDAFIAQDIASCMLGICLNEQNLYTMAIGTIRREDKLVSDVTAEVAPLNTVIREQLALSLPEYMLPQQCIVLPELPLSPNGKVDLSRLPKVVIESQIKLPSTEIEMRICEIWAQILNRNPDEIDCERSFFNSGGNSLLAMRMVRQFDQQLSLRIKLEDIYNNSSVCAMAKIAEKQNGNHEREMGVL